MHLQKSKLPVFIFAIILLISIAMMLASSPTQTAQAQDIATPTPEVQIQIVGGQPADPGEWPWQVALITRGETVYYGQFCGGTLIDPQWVVTAAHCITDEANGNAVSDPSTIDVVAGIFDLTNTSGDTQVHIAQIIRHPQYNPNTFNNDIALLRLETPIAIGGSGANKIATIPLVPSSTGTLAGTSAYVTGWGNTQYPADPTWPTELQEVQMPILSNTTCNDANHYGGYITDNMLCAGIDPSGGKDSCQGDSGGPLVISDGGWKLAGIVSWGYNCAESYHPGVYTRVSKYAIWVAANIDTTAPQVTSITRANTNPNTGSNVSFTVNFSEDVTGVDKSDFLLVPTFLSGASISGVTGSGSSYTVTVKTGSGSGTLGLDLVDNDSIIDAASVHNRLGGTGVGNGNFTGEIYTIDKSTPRVTSITRTDPNPTGAASVHYTVIFSEAVTGVNIDDFSLTTSGASNATLSGVSGTGTTYTVTIDTGSNSGTIRLDVIDDDSIINLISKPIGGTGAGNGNFINGEIYSIDRTPPAILSITPMGPLTTPANQVKFLATFSEVVTNVDISDFNLSTSGLSGAAIFNVSGSGSTRTITVNTGTGDGTAHLDFVDDDSILDLVSLPLGGVGAGNGDFTSTATFTIDKPDLPAPVLRSPRTNTITNTTTPTFWWSQIPNITSYEIEFATDSMFQNDVDIQTVSGTSYTALTSFTEGKHFWRVRAVTANAQTGKWSAARIFSIDITPPSAPVLISPVDPSTVRRTPTFKWKKAVTATAYEFQYSDTSATDISGEFTSPNKYTVTRSSLSLTPPVMSVGTYYWHVRAKDAYGNWGAWSSYSTVNITGP